MRCVASNSSPACSKNKQNLFGNPHKEAKIARKHVSAATMCPILRCRPENAFTKINKNRKIKSWLANYLESDDQRGRPSCQLFGNVSKLQPAAVVRSSRRVPILQTARLRMNRVASMLIGIAGAHLSSIRWRHLSRVSLCLWPFRENRSVSLINWFILDGCEWCHTLFESKADSERREECDENRGVPRGLTKRIWSQENDVSHYLMHFLEYPAGGNGKRRMQFQSSVQVPNRLGRLAKCYRILFKLIKTHAMGWSKIQQRPTIEFHSRQARGLQLGRQRFVERSDCWATTENRMARSSILWFDS